MILQDVQGQTLQFSWANGHGRKRRKGSYLLYPAEFIHGALVMLHAVLSQVQVSRILGKSRECVIKKSLTGLCNIS